MNIAVRETADLLGCAPETVRLRFDPFPKWAGALWLFVQRLELRHGR